VSPKKDKFVNPLLRSTEPDTETRTQESTETMMETATEASTSPDTQTTTGKSKPSSTYTSTDHEIDEPVERRKKGKQAFDKTHIRWSIWVRKNLKRQIEKLAKEQEISFVALADEAFTDLLKKYGK
jgi:hypothetical protein